MALLKKIDRHSGLMQRMAETRGADLGEALLDGQVTAAELRGAVLRCMLCEEPDDCEARLAEALESGAHIEVPEYCRNRALMVRIARD